MNNKLTVISYTFAAIAGICFVQGLAILSQEKGLGDHGRSEKIYCDAGPNTEG